MSAAADGARRGGEHVCLSGAAPAPDARDPVRDLGHHLRAAARSCPATSSTSCSPPPAMSIPPTRPIWRRNSASTSRSSCSIWHWIGGLLRGDLGYSYVSEKPALEEILPRIPITARLAGLALLFSTSIGIPLGVISAVQAGHAARLRAARGQPERPVAALVLARPADPDGVGGDVRPDADLQSQSADLAEAFATYCRAGRWRSASAAPR